MDNKCSKYEGLFVFSDRASLEAHLAECDSCRAEHEKFKKVSGLLDEVKLHYLRKRRRQLYDFSVKAACAVLGLLLFSSLTFGIIANDEDLLDTLRYGGALSAEDLGFPVDSYGLLTVD